MRRIRYATIWPKGPITWTDCARQTLFLSVPFTWNLPEVRARLVQREFSWDRARVGGPAVDLMPHYLEDLPDVEVGGRLDGVLQRVNPDATRTTTGCPNRCGFCGVGQGLIEPGGLRELADWPDGNIVCDNNLLAASREHFDRVIDRLLRHEWCDFNQGLDARFVTPYHAARIGELPRAMVRLAADAPHGRAGEGWQQALEMLGDAGVPRSRIRTFALVGYGSGPDEAWARCRDVESYGVKVLPMWYHALDALEHNAVTPEQQALGWTDLQRKGLMQWFYQHRTSRGRYRKAVR